MAADEHPHADIGAETSSASDLAHPRSRGEPPHRSLNELIRHPTYRSTDRGLRGGSRLRVIATDASDAMLRLARSTAPGVIEIRRVTLPFDPIPLADAIVGVGHALNYLDEESQVNEALVAIAESLRPGGLVAIDLCDLKWGRVRANDPPKVWRTKDWVLMTEFSVPEPNRFIRFMTTFVRNDDRSWRRDDERHDNVLIDTSKVPELLSRYGVNATTSESFGDAQLPSGLVAVVGRKTGSPDA